MHKLVSCAILFTIIGWRAYDDSRGVGVKNTTFQVSPTEYESEYRLERYDLGRVFDVRT